MSKEDKIMEVLNGFMFNEEIEEFCHISGYDLALKRLTEITDSELETYSIGDYSNIIGDLLEGAKLDIIKLFIEVRELYKEDYVILKSIILENTTLEEMFDYHFEGDEDDMINWKCEDLEPCEIVGYNIEEDENIVELSDGYYYFYNF